MMRHALSLLAAVLLLWPASASAESAAKTAPADALLAKVPAAAYSVVVVDQEKMAGHPGYQEILRFLDSQGWGEGLRFALAAGMKPGEQVRRTVSFERSYRSHGSLLAGDLDVAKLKAHAKATLGDAFEEGEHAGKAWFRVGDKLRAADLGDGVVAFAGDSLMEAVLDLAAGQGKAITKREKYRALKKAASKDAPTLWGMSWVADSARKRLKEKGSEDMAHVRRTTIRAEGTGDMKLRMVGYTADEAGAEEVVEAVRGKIERKIMGSTLLKVLGVAALAQRIELRAEGKRAVASLELTAEQITLLATAGPRALAILAK